MPFNCQNLTRFTFLILLICANLNLFAQTEDQENPEEIVDINLSLIQQNLLNAPEESSVGPDIQTTLLILPLPGSQEKAFFVQESPLLSKKQSTIYPDIKSYILIDTAGGNTSGRMSVTPKGVSYTIFTEERLVLLENFVEADTTYHKVYYGNFNEHSFGCGTGTEDRLVLSDASSNGRNNTISTGGTLRTYRMAVASSGEFTAGNGGTNASVTAAINEKLNQLNAIYEKELTIRFILAANNDNIIFTNASTDGLDPNNRISTAQTVINANMNTADFDIGHVFYEIPSCGQFCSSGSGVATLGSACNGTLKSRGWTGATGNAADDFFMGIFAHEIGHQFGAHHTFYGTDGNCAGSQRSPGNGYEPGGGNTLMSYETTCNNHNITPKVNTNYFHIHSISQILNHTVGTGSCFTGTATGNTPPQSMAPADVTIPRGTPFTITGSGTDADGDNLTYIWEQYDTDNNSLSLPNGAPNDAANSTTAPLFRSFDPSATGHTRTFPQLSDILNNTQTQGEILPQVGRTMHFRLTARDNNVNGGGLHCDEVAITVDDSGVPFVVTLPTAANSYTANGANEITVNWNVGATASAPISCNTVDISLSTDGGNTFSINLASGTTNDGTESIVLPANLPNSSTARIKVACANGGVEFFDLSDGDFTIISSCSEQNSTFSPKISITADQGNASLNLSLNPDYGTAYANFTGALANTDGSSNLAYSNNTTKNGPCGGPSNSNYYDAYTVYPSGTGSYTFNRTAGNSHINIYLGDYVPNSVCNNFLGSMVYDADPNDGFLNISSSLSVNLTADTKYTVVVEGFSTSNTYLGNYTFTYTNANGTLYNDTPDPGASFTYIYIAVDNAGVISKISANSDFTSLSAGTYTVYGVIIPTSDISNFNSYANTNTSEIYNGVVCLTLSANTIILTINAPPCSSPTPSLGTTTDPTTCDGTEGSIQLTGLTATTAYTLNYKKDNIDATAVPFTSDGSGNYVLTGLSAGVYSAINVTISTCTSANLGPTTLSEPTDPSVNAVSNQTVCAGANTAVINFSGTGASYSWTNSNSTIGIPATGTGNITAFQTINAGTTVQIATITVTPKLNNCDGPTTSFTITVNPLPSVDAISNQSVCANASTAAINFGGTGSSYTWTNDNTSIGLAASGTGNIAAFTATNSGTTVQTANIVVTPKLNGCDGPTKSFTIMVNPLPSVDAISNQSVCANASTAAINFGGTGSSYTWTNDNTSTGLAASGTGNIAAFTATNSGTTVQTANIVVTPKLNGCDGPTKSFTITVNPLPSVDAISNQSVCANASTAAINFGGTGSSYTWTNDNTSIGLAASGTGNIAAFTATNSGTTVQTATITVTPKLNNCDGPTKSFTITVNPLPSVNTISDQTICADQNTAAISFSGTGSSYTWTNDNTSINLAASGTGNIAAFAATNSGTTVQTATITVTPKLNNCDGPTKSFTITVNPLPSVNTISDQTICADQNTAAISFSGTGSSYTWTNNNTSINLAASGTGNIAAFTATNSGTTVQTATIVVTPKLNGCDGPTKSFTITVNPLPSVDAISNQTVTAGDMTTAITFSGTGTSYSWTNDNTSTGLGASGTGNIPAFTTTNAGVSTITVTPILNSCDGPTKTFTITVNSAAATCMNDILNVDNSTDNTTYNCDTVSSAEVIPSTYTIIYEGCKEVVLKPGFQYAPTGAATFTARVTSCNPLTNPENNVSQARINTQYTPIASSLTMTIRPNPAKEYTTIDYQLKEAAMVSIRLYDMTGKQLAIIAPKQTKVKGAYQQQVALSDFNAGMYFVVLQTETEQISKKMILIK